MKSRQRCTRVLATPRRKFVIATLLCGAFSCDAARSDDATVSQSAPASSINTTQPNSPEEARLSLDVTGAPMAQVFSLIEAMTQVRARYAAPPDALLSAHFEEEPLLPALEKMLSGSNWTAQRDDTSLFLRAQQNTKWQIWTGETAPRTAWNLAPDAREYSLPAVRLNSSPDAPSRLTASLDKTPGAAERALSPAQKAARAAQEAQWKSAPITFDAWRTPGVIVENIGGEIISAANTNIARKKDSSQARGDAASTRGVWMRCDVTLRVVPVPLYLLLATPSEATLWINGAPVLSRRSGQSRVEVSQLLRRGANRVALHWKNAPPLSSEMQPLLRYEWQSAVLSGAP